MNAGFPGKTASPYRQTKFGETKCVQIQHVELRKVKFQRMLRSVSTMCLNAFGDRLVLQGSSLGIFWAIIAHFFFLLLNVIFCCQNFFCINAV